MIRERTLAGLERAKSEGKTLGRREVVNDEITSQIVEFRSTKDLVSKSHQRSVSVEEPCPTSSRSHNRVSNRRTSIGQKIQIKKVRFCAGLKSGIHPLFGHLKKNPNN